MGKKKTSKAEVKKAAQASNGGNSKADSTAHDLSHKQQRKAAKSKKGKEEWQDELQEQLRPLGLRVKKMEPDGNCFFRSLADQLQGSDGDHVDLRQRVLDYIAAHPEDFQPFIEDDEPFDTYVKRLRKDGVWAGHVEIVATSQLLRVNFRIFQPDQPCWVVGEFPSATSQTLHFSYHGGQHYNSVRAADDFGDGPPAPIRLAVAPAATNGGGEGDGAVATGGKKKKVGDFLKEEAVMEESGCYDLVRVRRALSACGGNIEEAVIAITEDFACSSLEDPTSSLGLDSMQPEAACTLPEAPQETVSDPSGDPNPTSTPPQPTPDPSTTPENIASAVPKTPSDPPEPKPRPVPPDPNPPPAETPLDPSAAGEGSKGVRDKGSRGPQRVQGGRGRGSEGPKTGLEKIEKWKKKDEKKQPKNQKCPCGSNKKQKSCCGKAAGSASQPKGGEEPGLEPGIRQLQVLSI